MFSEGKISSDNVTANFTLRKHCFSCYLNVGKALGTCFQLCFLKVSYICRPAMFFETGQYLINIVLKVTVQFKRKKVLIDF